ncbi:unnamed protein product [Allacma fusca]|uniref:MACPF domain-containing protein n=1 Tax=Allacma fusca TaxID=39272 RepID=A0A8J2PEA9_9HEXA|nr:unnamed protein product [Allacma fusca]
MGLFRILSPDPGMENFLKTALGLTAPCFQFDLLLGRAFNIIRDTVTDFQVFELGEMSFNEIGCSLPCHVKATCAQKGQLTWFYAPLKKDLDAQRLLQLNLERGPRSSVLEYETRPGFNLPSTEKLSAVYEYHLFQIDFKPTAPINPAFETIVSNLPKTYDVRNEDNRNQWREFLATVGSHFVSSAFIGGSLIFELQYPSEETVANLNASQLSPEVFFTCLMDMKALRPGSSQGAGQDFSVIVMGGDKSKGEGLVKSENIDELIRRIKDWEASVYDDPIVTDNNIGLSEVAEVVDHIDAVKGAALRSAVLDLHNIKLKKRRNCIIS